jgi:hypothetical protein
MELKILESNFGYKSPVKDAAIHCAYTGELFTNKNKPTFEHICPKSLGGSNDISNCLATTLKSNNKRGNMLFNKWLILFPRVIKNIQNYLNEMRGVEINGHDYVEEVKKTLNKEAKGVAVFHGNRLDYKI